MAGKEKSVHSNHSENQESFQRKLVVAWHNVEPWAQKHQEIWHVPSRKPWPTSKYNIVYVKVPKSASSTTSGIARRLAAKQEIAGVGTDTWITDEPGVWANHNNFTVLREGIVQLQMRTFLFSFIRDPVDRCLSGYYHFKVSRGGEDATAAHLIDALIRCKNMGSRYLSVKLASPTSIMNMYDFIGIAGNLYDASVVALAHILQRPITDVLYVPAKVADGHHLDDLGFEQIRHGSIQEEPGEVQKYAASKEFRNDNSIDYAILKMATTSLTQMYRNEGPQLTELLATYQKLKDLTASRCGKIKPCVYTLDEKKAELWGSMVNDNIRKKGLEVCDPGNCYWHDNGCGYKCLDGLLATFNETEISPFNWKHQPVWTPAKWTPMEDIKSREKSTTMRDLNKQKKSTKRYKRKSHGSKFRG